MYQPAAVRSRTGRSPFFQGRAVAQAVSRVHPTAAARVRQKMRSCGIFGGQSGTETGSLPALRFLLPILITATSCEVTSSTES
jgi:hypothetical protein